MLSVEEAQERVLSFFDVLEPERKAILETLGQVLAEDVVGSLDIPPLDNSAMDGYALQAESVTAASRASAVLLRVVGTIAAGQLPNQKVTRGKAVRIMTGAPVPQGADAIVPFEDTDEADRKAEGRELNEIGVFTQTAPGANIRPAGQDIKRGQRVLEKGKVLRPADLGLLASLGCAEVSVIRRPLVAIVATGDEVTDPKSEASPGEIYDSNSYSLGAAVVSAGGLPKLLGIAGDDTQSIADKLEEGMTSDILITSAGVSKGDYDLVKDVLGQYGSIEFWSVRMRPAKPLAFGVFQAADGRAVTHLGVPGNPVSALVAFEEFGRLAIYKMLGKGRAERPTIEAVLEEPIHNTDGRRVYARAVVTKRNGTYYARLTGHQGSNLLMSMALANGLAICPEDVPVKQAGETVQVKMLNWPEAVF